MLKLKTGKKYITRDGYIATILRLEMCGEYVVHALATKDYSGYLMTEVMRIYTDITNNPSCTPYTLHHLLDVTDPKPIGKEATAFTLHVYKCVMGSPNVTSEILLRIYDDTKTSSDVGRHIQHYLTKNNKTPTEVLFGIASGVIAGDDIIHLAKNTNINDAIAGVLLNCRYRQHIVKSLLSRNSSVSNVFVSS